MSTPDGATPGRGTAGRPRSLRRHLVWLVVGVLAPVVGFAGVLAWRVAEDQRAAAERRQIQAARDVAEDLDRELVATIRALEALAQTRRLDPDANDIAAFRVYVMRAIKTQPSWAQVLLRTPDGRCVMDTLADPPSLPVVEPVSFARLTETGQPTIGPLARGPGGVWAFPVRAPVVRDRQLRYVVTAVIQPEGVANLVSGRPGRDVGGEWTRAIVDDAGTVVARSRAPGQFVGTPVREGFRAHTAAATEGIYRDTTVDGVRAYCAFARAPRSGWRTAVVVPVEVIDGPVRATLWAVAGVGGGILLVSGFGAWLFARRVARGIGAAAAAAERLSAGEPPALPPSSVAEVARLGEALRRSAELLAARERERADHLARAEAARAQAEAASGAKDQFLAALSHELRTPLTPALAAVQMLEADAAFPGPARDALAMVRRNVQLEVKLIDDLLDLTRVARGKLELRPEAVDLHARVREAADICAADVAAKGLRLSLDLSAGSPVVWADPARLQQALWNLIGNAVKFTPAGGEVRVETRAVPAAAAAAAGHNGDARGGPGPAVEVRVTDSGIGIEPASLARIFDAFEQGGASVTRQFGGLGLGLAISRAIVDGMGGSLAAASAGRGQGATFTLSLPVVARDPAAQCPQTPAGGACDTPAAPAAPATAASTDAPPPPPRPVRVLLVEDNPDTSAVMARLLKRYGCDVRTAGSVAEGIVVGSAAGTEVDLLLSDVGLPDGSGCDLVRELLARWSAAGRGGPVAAVAISGFGMDDDVRRSLAAGFGEHLTKPVDIRTVEQLVRRVRAELDARMTVG